MSRPEIVSSEIVNRKKTFLWFRKMNKILKNEKIFRFNSRPLSASIWFYPQPPVNGFTEIFVKNINENEQFFHDIPEITDTTSDKSRKCTQSHILTFLYFGLEQE